MRSRTLKLFIASILVAVATFLGVAPAYAEASCDTNVSNASRCFLATNDDGSSFYGRAGDFYSCPLIYFKVKVNDGYDKVESISFEGIGVTGKITPGSVVTASVRIDQECISYSEAYEVELRLEGLVNAPVVGKKIGETFTYRKKLSGRIDDYCFTEICGYTNATYEFQIPPDFKQDLISVKAKVYSKLAFSTRLLMKEIPYSDVFSVGERLINPKLANIDGSMSEVDGRIICYISDASESAISKFGMRGFKFEIVEYVEGNERILDSGTWNLGTPPNNYLNVKMSHGNASSAVVQGIVFHTFHFTDQTLGHTYGCKFKAVTLLGESLWNENKLSASRTVIRGYAQALPNVKVLCARLNKTYPGGIAASSKARNVGAKVHLKAKVSPTIYKANAALDIDNDGLVCEK